MLRLLPPNLTEEQFFNTLSGVLEQGFLDKYCDDRYYFKGHFSRKPFRLPTYSRAYLTFYEAEKVQVLAKAVSGISFVDDTNNSMTPTMTLSPYIKKLRTEESKGLRKVKDLVEGTIEQDKTFRTFLKSLELFKSHKEEYQYADLSVIAPLEKALERKREEEAGIKLRGERAIVELAGEIAKEKTKKKKSKKKKKAVADGAETKKKKLKGVPSNSSSHKQNVVIIEAAGRRELQRRERLKKKSEKKGNSAGSSKKQSSSGSGEAKPVSAKTKNKPGKKKRNKKTHAKAGKEGSQDATRELSAGKNGAKGQVKDKVPPKAGV